MRIPSIEEVHMLWDEYHVPKNVRLHSEAVAKVAVFIAEKLEEKGIRITREVVEKAALLHDLTRSANFENFDMQPGTPEKDIEFWKNLKKKCGHIDHADSAADILQGEYPEVAKAIRAHSINSKLKGLESASWEEKVLSYSDLRVVHERITSLEERHEDSKKRHANFFEAMQEKTGIDYRKKITEHNLRLEKQIFEMLDINPEDINRIK